MNTIAIPAGMETAVFVLEDGALRDVPAVLKQYFPGKTPFVIADENTWAAAGKQVQDFLTQSGLSPLEPKIYPAEPRLHPDKKYSDVLAERFSENIVPVAVGSGVINDVVKCASGTANVRYCCVPTACSVDGYTSAGAAMAVNGFKITVKCPAPYAVVADPVVLRSAPAPMMASGYADLLTKVVAGADWRIVDALGIEPVDPPTWALVQKNLRKWVSDCTDLSAIFEGLAATGYSMQLYHESRPASGAEHMISHVWEMEGLQCQGEDVSHGFKVGIGLLATARLQNFVLEHSWQEICAMADPVKTPEARSAELKDLLKRNCYGSGVYDLAMGKSLFGEAGEKRRDLIASCWTKIQQGIREQLLPEETLRKMLKTAHCPTLPEEIGLTHDQYVGGILRGSLIRTRYTVFDLLEESGVFRKAVEQLF